MSAPTYAATQPTAYMPRVVATGLASAAGALFTSLIDVRGTLIGAVLVAMTVSALGQAMREPLDRLERRLKGLGVQANPSEARHARVAPDARACCGPRCAGSRGGGVIRSIVVIGLLGFLFAMGAVGVREIAHSTNLRARIMQEIQPLLIGNADPAAPESADEDTDATPEHQPADRGPAAPVTELAKKVTPSGPTSPSSAESGQSPGTPKSQETAVQK